MLIFIFFYYWILNLIWLVTLHFCVCVCGCMEPQTLLTSNSIEFEVTKTFVQLWNPVKSLVKLLPYDWGHRFELWKHFLTEMQCKGAYNSGSLVCALFSQWNVREKCENKRTPNYLKIQIIKWENEMHSSLLGFVMW